MNITANIKLIKESPREWTGRNGTMHSVEGEFEDGSNFEVTCKPENSAGRITELRALTGKLEQYEVEPKKDYNGRKQWHLKSWPGKPEKQPNGAGFIASGGTRGTYQVRFRDTEEGFLREQHSIHRSVALQRAVEWLGKHADMETAKSIILGLDEVVGCADRLYAWLSQDTPKEPAKPPGPAVTQHSEGGPERPPNVPPALQEQAAFFDSKLTTGDRVPANPAYGKYIEEIAKAQDATRLTVLVNMIDSSQKKGSVTVGQMNELYSKIEAREVELKGF